MTTDMPDRWDRIADVVVLGSGAAGLTAATMAHDGGAEVVVVEKADLIGGTTGVSGGMPWVPLNRHMADLGIDDDREEALTYIRRLTLGREPDPALLETYVDCAHEMIEYLEEHTPLEMYAPSTFNDYYEGLPGGRPAGRSIEPVPYDVRTELGEWAPRLRTSPHLPRLTMEEGAKFLRGGEPPDLAAIAARETDDIRVGGPALVAMLFKGLLDRGVDVISGVSAKDLVLVDGAVAGVRCESSTGSILLGARKGVVLACGGFEWNDEMVQAFIGQTIHPLSPPTNTGDALAMAMSAGASLANMTSFWGQPALLDPDVEFEGEPMYQMGTVRSFPGVIVVNRHGRRFTNEGVTYQDFPKTLGTYDPVAVEYPNEEHWLVFDQGVRDRAVILPSVLPGGPTPSWISTADTIEKLAAEVGIDPVGLHGTVEHWNAEVASGEDHAFRRGTVRFEAHMSGSFPSPTTMMAPVAQPPFYAVRLYNGALGTSGGCRIDEHGRVRHVRGGVIDGLYAAGNAAASVFGPAYPGGGATIGPAMTFGYLAGKHAASVPGRAL